MACSVINQQVDAPVLEPIHFLLFYMGDVGLGGGGGGLDMPLVCVTYTLSS